MIKFITEHVDWLGAGLSLTGYFLMAKHRRRAIIILIGTNLVWGMWAFVHHVTSLYVLNICYFILNVRTMLIWKKENNIVLAEPVAVNNEDLSSV